jgi:hypothetical protein
VHSLQNAAMSDTLQHSTATKNGKFQNCTSCVASMVVPMQHHKFST